MRGFARQHRPSWLTFERGHDSFAAMVLLRLSHRGQFVLVWQGVPMNWTITTESLDPWSRATSHTAGPVAAPEISRIWERTEGAFSTQMAPSYENPSYVEQFLLRLLAIVYPPAHSRTRSDE